MRGTHRDMRGFEYLAYSTVSFVLLFVLVLLPVAPAFASEEVSEGAGTEAGETVEVAETEATDEAPPETGVSSEESFVSETEVEASPVLDVLPEDSETMSSTEVLDTEAEAINREETALSVLGGGDTETPTPEEVTQESVTDGEVGGGAEILDEVPVSDGSEDSQAEDVSIPATENATTATEEIPSDEEAADENPEESTLEETEEVIEEVEVSGENLVVVDALGGNSNLFSFRKEECVSVGDGSFYCSTTSTAPAVVGMDRVFAAPDADGDKEIYIEKGAELASITENLLDDDAPYYDERSETIVWHRLVDGRYQIVSFDLDDEEETVLTNDRYNNMEPSRYGDVTVWQGWIGNDWEIMLMENDEITMLTDNTWNDVAPNVNGAYIVWQSFEEGAWRVKVYDTLTKETMTIDDAEGASVENPRFVLVYDSKQDNGDVETRGYDLEKKTAVPLSAKPAPVPESIPDPDQTGEDRALIQAVTQLKPKTEGEEDVPDDLPIPAGDPGADWSTTTPAVVDDVIIPSFEAGTTTETIEGDTISSDTTPSTEHIEDVVIPDISIIEGTSATDHIEDIIVTPYVEPIEEVSGTQTE